MYSIKSLIHNTLAIYYRWRSRRVIEDWFKSGKYLEHPDINIYTEQFKKGIKSPFVFIISEKGT